MIYTIIFYLILLFTTTQIRNRNLSINIVVVVSAIYMGLRYDYMPDYQAYNDYFNMVASNYEYWEGEHMEYGWYLLNKLFSPFGFFVFEFTISSFFAYSIGIMLKTFVTKEYLPYVVLGYFTSGVFPMTLSAHRQLVVAAIFSIALCKLVINHVHSFKDLISRNLVLYYLSIILSAQIHTSAYFLLLIPLLYFLPKNKILILFSIACIYLAMFVGEKYLPSIVGDFYLLFDRYEQTLQADIEMERMTILSFFSYSMQIIFIYYAYSKKSLGENLQLVLFLYLLTIFLAISIFSVPQLFRLNAYIGLFSYIGLDAVGRGINYKKSNISSSTLIILKSFYGFWIFWNALKVLSIQPGTVQEYKTILSLIFI